MNESTRPISDTTASQTVRFYADPAHEASEFLRRVQHFEPRDVMEWIQDRPVLAEVVIREANSVNNALVRRIETVEHAVAYLGLHRMQRLAERLMHHGDQQEFRRRAALAATPQSANQQLPASVEAEINDTTTRRRSA